MNLPSPEKRMILRADHVAGAAFILFGCAIIALSGNLPVGALSMPGAGFLPMIVAVLTIVFGLALVLPCVQSIMAEVYRARERGRAFGGLFTISACGRPLVFVQSTHCNPA